MASEKVQQVSGGIGFGGLLAILFIGLKLTGNIDWSWWWVLSPLWIPIALVLTIIAGVLLFAFGCFTVAKIVEKCKENQEEDQDDNR